MPETIPPEKFYGLEKSLELQLKASAYMQTLNQTILREKKKELRKRINQMESGEKK